MGMGLVNPSWEVSWCVRPGVQERVTLRGHFYISTGKEIPHQHLNLFSVR